ncbi:hypothetical protein CPC08DRAFT_381861 [Agrocybe pediades]|nr:hypothetical protein CPC08DRAFT_381861 [Agrocybe pediades]
MVITLGVVLIRKRARSNKEAAPNASGLVVPFSDSRPSGPRSTYNALEKHDIRYTRVTNGDGRNKQRRGIEDGVALAESTFVQGTRPTPGPSNLPHIAQTGRSPVVTEPAVVSSQPRYRMHEDAGSVRSITPEEDEVIDVPPNYSSIVSRFRRGPGEHSTVDSRRVPNPAVNEEGAN